MAEERILPPFPDELITGKNKEGAIRLLLDLELPTGIAQRHLRRFGDVAAVAIGTGDLRRVARFPTSTS